MKPQVAGLPERVFVVRQQFTNPNSWIAGPYQLTLNYQPAIAPLAPSPVIRMKPGVKEYWRVANASSQGFLALQVWFGTTPQNLEVIELDGIPVKETTQATTIQIPPAGRAEFVVESPPANQTASFQHIGFNTGPIGNPNPPQELAMIETSAEAQEPPELPRHPHRLPQARHCDSRDWIQPRSPPSGRSISPKPRTERTGPRNSSSRSKDRSPRSSVCRTHQP